jgi:hypothetical protein
MSNRPICRSLLAPVLITGLCWPAVAIPAAEVADRYRTTQSDFGGVGLLQTPTARMAPDGDFSFNGNRTSPYSRYSIAVTPLPWFEGTIRYMAITNRLYGPRIAGDQSYKDKAIDAKVRLWEESYWLPQVAFGMRDIGGTGLFSSEYLVFNKRFHDLDFSLGMATGYIGNRGDFSNPLGIIDPKFKERPSSRTSDVVGDFNQDNYFRGPIGVFGGVEYQTPWHRLRLKLEYEGNDYQSEPQRNNQVQDSPFNLGAVFKVGRAVDLHAAWERGNTAMFGITFHTNLKTGAHPAKLLDPSPEPRQPLPAGVSATEVDWADVSLRLQQNAGFAVEQISVKDREVIITGNQSRFRDEAKGLGRAARVLDNATGEGTYDWYTLVSQPAGMPVSETSINAQRLRDLEEHRIDLHAMRRSVVNSPPSVVDAEVLHTQPLTPFDWGLGLGYNQNMGGPDGFILYQFLARGWAQYRFSRNQWVQTVVGANLINNFDKFRYDAPSKLPRVRTRIREYLTTSDVAIENMQYTFTHRLEQDWYAMGYGGLLESMFGGIGGEVLYRPHDDVWAVGVDMNWVRQRGFARDFSFRDYSVLTGHATGYLQTGFHDVLAKVSVGRYLARDLGATLDLSRRYDNGITIGAWATITNVSAEQFGEGSFDKGIYFTFPFDAFFSRSSRSAGTLAWAPLTRDGGARLGRYYQLYEMTHSADVRRFNSGFKSLQD